MKDKEIISRLELSLEIMYIKDNWLLIHEISERSITHKIASYLQILFPEYNVDCEYNGDITQATQKKKIWIVRKELEKRDLLTKDEKKTPDEIIERDVYPDIIIHRRGTNDDNLCIIEIKKSSSKVSFKYDEIKLKAYTRSDGYGNNLKYQLGIFIELETGQPELKYTKGFFKEGKEIEC